MTATPDLPAPEAEPPTVEPPEPEAGSAGSGAASDSGTPDGGAAAESVAEAVEAELTDVQVEPVSQSESQPEPDFEPVPVPVPEPDPVPEPEPNVVGVEDLPATVAVVRDAVRAGECVVLPTDTVYGIGADAFSSEAVQRLLDAKQRGRDMPPPVLIADGLMLDTLVDTVPAAARALADAHWPGPLTLILKAHSSLRMDLGETGGTIAVRVPDNDVARAILRATGPLAVSSANVSGQDPAIDVSEATAQLRATVAVYVDGGPTPGSVPSTIVDFSASDDGRIVRLGVLSHEVLVASAPLLEDGTAVPEPEPEPGSAEPDTAVAPGDGESAAHAGAEPAESAATTADESGDASDAGAEAAASETTAAADPQPSSEVDDLVPPPVDGLFPGAPPLIPNLHSVVPDEQAVVPDEQPAVPDSRPVGPDDPTTT